MLSRELERAAARGEELPAADVILSELRRLTAEQPAESSPAKDPARLFLDQFVPFVFDRLSPVKVQGRILKDSLQAIWNWIGRDLAPSAVKEFEAKFADLAEKDAASSERALREFQGQLIPHIERALTAVSGNEKAQRRLAGRIAAPGTLADVEDVLGILKARPALVQLAPRFPLKINNLSDDQLDHIKSVLNAPIARTADVFPYALVVLMNRLVQPWQLIRVAVKAVNSDAAARIAETPFGFAVSLVLVEIDRAVAALRDDFAAARSEAALARMKEIHDALRGVRTELDVSVDSPWARQLSAIRSTVSQLLQGEIEQLPGLVRRVLRGRPGEQVAKGATLDPSDIAEAEAKLELLIACRSYANELALNEAALRINADLQNYLETHTNSLVTRLRNAGSDDREFCRLQVDAAVRFCGKLFGSEYAALLTKAAEVADNAERRAAKA